MNFRYLFTPKNPNLNHCPESFYEAFKAISFQENYIERIDHANLDAILSIVRKLMDLKSQEEVSLFFFSIQLDSLISIAFLRMISSILSKQLKVYYMMHEPKLEKGRVSSTKAFLVYYFNLLFGHLSDKVFLPSNEAVTKAKTFVETHKICPVNLTFISVPDRVLEQYFLQLKYSWEDLKTFSYIGTADKDKNLQGFLSLARIVNKEYPDKTRFIRAGRDNNMHVSYDEDIIVRFAGYISPKAKRFLLGLTHFVVIPYSFSTQSGVITEALSYGKLLIVNDIPAFSCLKNLSFVFLVDFSDEKAILQCINDLFNMNVSDYKRCYWEAIKYFQQEHSEKYLLNIISQV